MLDRQNKDNLSLNNEVINGQVTSKSYETYSTLCNPKKKYNLKSVLLVLFFTVLLCVSVLVFSQLIKSAYFSNSNETEPSLIKIKTECDNNDNIKVENVTKEISNVFGIPIGVKIIELSDESIVSSGLRTNDIIVKVNGTNITTIDELNVAMDSVSSGKVITLTIYRNGIYKSIVPYSEKNK